MKETARERTQEPLREEAIKRKGGEFTKRRRKQSGRTGGKKRRKKRKAKCEKSTRTRWWSEI